MEEKSLLQKIGPWVPLLIAAGYFVFLIATWQTYIVNMHAQNDRFDDMLSKIEAKGGILIQKPESKDD